MKKLITVFLIVLFSGWIPVSCTKNSDAECYGLTKTKDFHIKSLAIKTVDAAGNMRSSSETYPVDSIFLAIYPDKTESIAAAKLSSFFPSGFSNLAMACSPATPVALEKLSQLDIIATENFVCNNPMDSINAGDTITNLFLVAIKSYGAPSFEPINEFFQHQDRLDDNDKFWLKLATTPQMTTSLKFEINIQLTDSARFSFNDLELNVN